MSPHLSTNFALLRRIATARVSALVCLLAVALTAVLVHQTTTLAGALHSPDATARRLSRQQERRTRVSHTASASSATSPSFRTSQLCHIAADESEVCVYDGPLCYDGRSLFVVVPDEAVTPSVPLPPVSPHSPNTVRRATKARDAAGERARKTSQRRHRRLPYTEHPRSGYFAGGGQEEGEEAPLPTSSIVTPTHPCLDWRTMEPSSGCGFSMASSLSRSPFPNPSTVCGGGVPSSSSSSSSSSLFSSPLFAQSCADAILTTPVEGRAWGPQALALQIQEMRESDFEVLAKQAKGTVHLADPTSPRARKEGGDATRWEGEGEGEGEGRGRDVHEPGLVWLDGALWVAPMRASWWDHPYHASAALFPLWHAKRRNGSIIHVPRRAAGLDDGGGSGEEEKEEERGDDGHEDIEALSTEEESLRSLSLAKNAAAHPLRLTHGGGASGAGAGGGGGGEAGGSSSSSSPYPSLDYLLLHDGGSDDGKARLGVGDVGRWMTGIWPMVSQPHTTLLTRAGLEKELGLRRGAGAGAGRGGTGGNSTTTTSKPPSSPLVCARKGAVLGLQPRLFAGVGDANAFRAAAWALAGEDTPSSALVFPPFPRLPATTHARYPPRKITVLARSGTASRAFYEKTRILSLLRATGLPVEWVEDMGARSFEEQVRLMRGTGILLAAHGAALTNLIFLPAHAVVIEAFGYLMNWPLYRRAAEVASLYYYRLPAPRPSPPPSGGLDGGRGGGGGGGGSAGEGEEEEESEDPTRDPSSLAYARADFELFDNPSFYSLCEDPQRVSSIDANLLQACNSRSKQAAINVDFFLLSEILVMALDDIGCRPRQFSPSQSAALFAAQEALLRDVRDGKSVEEVVAPGDDIILGKQRAGKKDSGKEEVGAPPTDPEKYLREAIQAALAASSSSSPGALSGDVDGRGEEEGARGGGGWSPRAKAGLALARALRVDLLSLRFVQPVAGVKRVVNVGAKCTDSKEELDDAAAWGR